MDVGQDNFRFTLDDPEKRSKAIRYPMCTELHVNSLDRITKIEPPFAGQFDNPSQAMAQLVFFTTRVNSPSTDCVIKTKRALLYGYYNRIGMSEFQLTYNVPTIVEGVNDLFQALVYPGDDPNPALTQYISITVPQGYYTPAMIGAHLQAEIRALGFTGYTVSHPMDQVDTTNGNNTVRTGFGFSTNNTDTWELTYEATISTVLSPADQLRAAKFNRLLGAGRLAFGLTQTYEPQNSNPLPTFVTSSPNWLQTDYIDIVSKALTNYKESKDTNTNVQAPLGVIGRIYMSDFASRQGAVGNMLPINSVWGCSPLQFTKVWTTVNWSQWSPNQSIDQIDIQLLDMWGDTIYWSSERRTEWQMTLVASE